MMLLGGWNFVISLAMYIKYFFKEAGRFIFESNILFSRVRKMSRKLYEGELE